VCTAYSQDDALRTHAVKPDQACCWVPLNPHAAPTGLVPCGMEGQHVPAHPDDVLCSSSRSRQQLSTGLSTAQEEGTNRNTPRHAGKSCRNSRRSSFDPQHKLIAPCQHRWCHCSCSRPGSRPGRQHNDRGSQTVTARPFNCHKHQQQDWARCTQQSPPERFHSTGQHYSCSSPCSCGQQYQYWQQQQQQQGYVRP